MYRLIKIFINTLFISFVLGISAQEKKVALVIGNANYALDSHIRPLSCPLNDAQEIATKLTTLGYKLSTGKPVLDGTRDAILDAIDQFAVDAAYADVVVFYYSGHAITYNEDSFIIPIGQSFKKSSMASRSISFNDIIEVLSQSRSRVKIMFLDACRNNPLSLGSNFADENIRLHRIDIDRFPPDLKICYAAQPGSTSDDGTDKYSPFTKAILEYIDEENLPFENFLYKVEQMVQEKTKTQKPFYEGNTISGFCFNSVANETNNSHAIDWAKDFISIETLGNENGHQWVDLGLSSGTKWATCNVGSNSPEQCGNFYKWGATKPDSEYEIANPWQQSIKKAYYDTPGMKRYKANKDLFINPLSGNDTAHELWGGDWRMPFITEFLELFDECTWEKKNFNDVEGYLVIGPNGNSIFFPTVEKGIGCYWSNSLWYERKQFKNAWEFFINVSEDHKNLIFNDRTRGHLVRPVCSNSFPDDVSESIRYFNALYLRHIVRNYKNFTTH